MTINPPTGKHLESRSAPVSMASTMTAIIVTGEFDEVDRTLGAAGLYRDVCTGIGKTPVPVPGPDDILVKLQVLSVCGSDYHMVTKNREGRPISSCPAAGIETGLVFGHEFSGTVVAMGSNVQGFSVGELVCADSLIPCRKESCGPCHDGLFNYCRSGELLGFQRHGVFSEFAAIPASSVHSLEKITERFGFEAATVIGSQIEPMAVAYHAMDTALRAWTRDRKPSCRILGAGPVGLYIAGLAQSEGLRAVIEEPLEQRRALAAKFGEVWEPERNASTPPEDDLIFDCHGDPNPTALFDRVGAGGGLIFLARAGQQLHLSLDALLNRGAHIHGVRGHIGFMRKAIDLVAEGKFDPRTVVTRELEGLESLQEWLLNPEWFMKEGKVVFKVG